MHQFPGQGQRETPVINGKGLVKLLLLLPGKKARQFVSESAEVLVRYIGGDETLVDEIRRNRQIAAENPNSVQAFMANQPGPSRTVNDDEQLLQRRKLTLELDRYEIENKDRHLKVLDQMHQWTVKHVQDPRMKERLQNDLVNKLFSISGGSSSQQLSIEAAPINNAPITVDELATNVMGLRLSTDQKCAIGKAIASSFRQSHSNEQLPKVEKYVNGEMRMVNAYPRSFQPTMESIIRANISK